MEIKIYTDYGTGHINIYGFVDQGGIRKIVGFNGKEFVYQHLDPGAYTDDKLIPLLRFPAWGGENILKSLLDALSGLNIKTENGNLLQGKLQATERHLEDMREFAKTMLLNITAK